MTNNRWEKPGKRRNLLEQLARCLEYGEYVDTFHSTEQAAARLISKLEIEYVLRNGWHEKSKDRFQARFPDWNYSIRGKTIDDRELRIIISFDDNKLLIITAIDLCE